MRSLKNIVKKIGSSSLASVGNLLVTEKVKARSIFYEYNSMCFYIANILCVPLLLVLTSFVSVFYGEAYTLSFLGSLFVVIILYFCIIEIPFDVYMSALGYFDKVKNCVVFQSIVNLILSLILLFVMGIEGVLLATVISYIVGQFAMYPKILNNNYFKDCKIEYYRNAFKLSIIGVISYLVMFIFVKDINIINLIEWFFLGVVTFILNFIFVTLYYRLINQIEFFERFKKLIVERRNKK